MSGVVDRKRFLSLQVVAVFVALRMSSK